MNCLGSLCSTLIHSFAGDEFEKLTRMCRVNSYRSIVLKILFKMFEEKGGRGKIFLEDITRMEDTILLAMDMVALTMRIAAMALVELEE